MTIHEKIVKYILRYLNGMIDQGIIYNGNLGIKLEFWNDANWGGEEGRESVSGFVATIAGGSITYSSKKQGSIALSSIESEYMALLHVLKELIWLHRFLKKSATMSAIKISSIAIIKALSPSHTIPNTIHEQNISTSNTISSGTTLKMERCDWSIVRRKIW
jgi:hypothetical protein